MYREEKDMLRAEINVDVMNSVDQTIHIVK